MLPALLASMASGETFSFHKLTRRHAIRLSPPGGSSVEECSIAVGEIVGFESIKSAARMNSAVVIFLDSVDKANQLLESGVVIQGTFTPVLSLVSPAKKIMISNVPPFLKNEMLEKELGRHGKLVSPIKMIPISSKSPHLKHVMSFRRQVLMIPKKSNEELNLIFKFKVDDFEYTVHVTSETMKCFGCGSVGHLIRSCPDKTNNSQLAANVAEQASVSADTSDVLPKDPPGNVQIVQREGNEVNNQENEVLENTVSKKSEQKACSDLNADLNVGETATGVVESVLCNDIDAMIDREVGKMSTKRKNRENKENLQQVTKVSKLNLMCASSQSEDGLMETQESEYEGSSDTQVDMDCAYPFSKIRSFLQSTKGMRSVKVEDFFPDLKLFLDSVRLLMKNPEQSDQCIFTDQEIYRLKKLLVKVRAQLSEVKE